MILSLVSSSKGFHSILQPKTVEGNDSEGSSDEALSPKRTNEYLVNQLLDVKLVDGIRTFLIRWGGKWNHQRHDTWEPEENIRPTLIHEFFQERVRIALVLRRVTVLLGLLKICLP